MIYSVVVRLQVLFGAFVMYERHAEEAFSLRRRRSRSEHFWEKLYSSLNNNLPGHDAYGCSARKHGSCGSRTLTDISDILYLSRTGKSAGRVSCSVFSVSDTYRRLATRPNLTAPSTSIVEGLSRRALFYSFPSRHWMVIHTEVAHNSNYKSISSSHTRTWANPLLMRW